METHTGPRLSPRAGFLFLKLGTFFGSARLELAYPCRIEEAK